MSAPPPTAAEHRIISTDLFDIEVDGVKQDSLSVGWAHFKGNFLLRKGAAIELHAHPNDHLMLFNTWKYPRTVYRVDCLLRDGSEVVIETKRMPGVGVLFAYIKAGVRHRISLARGRQGAFVCQFSHYDSNGRYLEDPASHG
jgi:hypothetical protein